ncbi:MAG: hypothetical protein ABIL01_20100 [Pseudomonadota bacterium]
MINRREIIGAGVAYGTLLSVPSYAQAPNATAGSFDQLLEKAIETDQVALGRDLRERQEYELFEYAGKGIDRRPLSSTKLSKRSADMIVAFEVTSKNAYERKYKAPIWPHGASGVTIGIGYDVGYVTKSWLHEDWDASGIPPRQIAELERACELTGRAAEAILPTLSGIDIPWASAIQQFNNFVLPRYTAETLAALPKLGKLVQGNIDCVGALVSLTYNRGASFSRETDRYREMRAIRRHADDERWDAIPEEIRKMQRLWKTPDGRPIPNMAGLLTRRELEAKLFEEGLK